MQNFTLIPGGNSQLEFLLNNYQVEGKSILIIGAGHYEIAAKLGQLSNHVELIVDEYESLLSSNVYLDKNQNIQAKLMDYSVTDFEDDTFDLIYAQASISTEFRKDIIKEMKRLLKNEGAICIGEMVSLDEPLPQFVENAFYNSGIEPIALSAVEEYYQKRNFKIISTYDISKELKKYYLRFKSELEKLKPTLSDQEKSYYKKLLNQVSHESNVYLNLGGEKFIGMKVLLCELMK